MYTYIIYDDWLVGNYIKLIHDLRILGKNSFKSWKSVSFSEEKLGSDGESRHHVTKPANSNASDSYEPQEKLLVSGNAFKMAAARRIDHEVLNLLAEIAIRIILFVIFW